MNFFQSYKKVLISINKLSKITTFLLIVVLLSEILHNAYLYSFYAERSWMFDHLELIIVSNGFAVLICLSFLLRFVFLWVKESKFIWFSQIAGFSGWCLILAYELTTNTFYYQKISYISTGYSDYFVWSSESLAFLLLAYLYLTPIKHLLIFYFLLLTQDSKK